MLDNFNKKIKKIIKFFPENISIFTSKTAVYFGLAVYWCVIVTSTLLNVI